MNDRNWQCCHCVMNHSSATHSWQTPLFASAMLPIQKNVRDYPEMQAEANMSI